MVSFQDGELELLREVVLLPVVLSVLERDKTAIEKSEIKTKWPYVESINVAMNRVTKQLGQLKRDLHKKGLKVAKEQKTDFGIDCIFLCRGYSQQFFINWDVIKSETQRRMLQYITGEIDHS